MKLKLTLEGSGEPTDLAITLDSQTTVGQLADHLVGRLAKIKQPSMIHVVDRLPRNPVGKIDKPALRSGLRSPQPI